MYWTQKYEFFVNGIEADGNPSWFGWFGWLGLGEVGCGLV